MDDAYFLNDLLECSVCLERLDVNNKVLPCQHTFCKKCLLRIVNTHKELRCPECRVKVNENVDELPANILLVRLLEGLKNNPKINLNNVQRNLNTFNEEQQRNNFVQRANLLNNDFNDTLNSSYLRSNLNNYVVSPSIHLHQQQSIAQQQQPQPPPPPLSLTQQQQQQQQRLQSPPPPPLPPPVVPQSIQLLHQQNQAPQLHALISRELNQNSNSIKHINLANLPRAKALFNYEGKEPGDLSFKKGDVIIIRKRVDANWLQGIFNDKQGYLPANYVQLITNAITAANNNSNNNNTSNPTTTNTTTTSVPLSINNKLTANIVLPLQTTPISAVSIPLQAPLLLSAPPTQSISVPIIPQCKALYDFRVTDVEEKDCLSFNVGNVITVIRRVDENWAEGKLNDKIGIFPVTFVEMNAAAKALMKSANLSEPTSPSRMVPPTPTLSTSVTVTVTAKPVITSIMKTVDPSTSKKLIDDTSMASYANISPINPSSAPCTPSTNNSVSSLNVTLNTMEMNNSTPPPPEMQSNSAKMPPPSMAIKAAIITTTTAANNCGTFAAVPASITTTTTSAIVNSAITSTSVANQVPLECSRLTVSQRTTPTANINHTNSNNNANNNQKRHSFCVPSSSTSSSSITLTQLPPQPQPSTILTTTNLPYQQHQRYANIIYDNMNNLYDNLLQLQSHRHSMEILSNDNSGPLFTDDTGTGEFTRSTPMRNSWRRETSLLETRNPISHTPPLPIHYVALYNYKPQKSDEIELRKGELYTVTEKCQDGWFKGASIQSGVSGVFPGNYVQVAKCSTTQHTQLPLQAYNMGVTSRMVSPINDAKNVPLKISDVITSAHIKPIPLRQQHQINYDLASTSNQTGSMQQIYSTALNNTSSVSSSSSSSIICNGSNLIYARPRPIPSTSNNCAPDWAKKSNAAATGIVSIVPPPPQRPPKPSANNSDSETSPSSGQVSPQWHQPKVVATRNVNINSQQQQQQHQVQQQSTKSPIPFASTNTISNMIGNDKLPPTAANNDKKDQKREKISLMKKWTFKMKSKSPPPVNYSCDNPSFESTSPTHNVIVANPGTSHLQPIHVRSGSCPNETLKGPQHRKSSSFDGNHRCKNNLRERYRCIVPYPPNADYELGLEVGDIVIVHRKREDGWFKGTLQRNGKFGLFPGSFVESF